MAAKRPVIGIPADRRLLGKNDQPYHLAGEKYVTAVLDVAGGLPLLVPAIGRELDLEELLETLDGLLFTGSPSNVEPHHYRGEPSEAGTLHDPHRDATTLPLIPRAIAAGVPVLGICRGFQEMNVAFGGTLWQKLHEVPGLPRSSRGPEAAARRAVRPGARGDPGAWRAAAAPRRHRPHRGQFPARPGRARSGCRDWPSRRARRTA